MGHRYKEAMRRLMELDKRQVNLLPPLQQLGYHVGASYLSQILREQSVGPTAEAVMNDVWKIIERWENEKHET